MFISPETNITCSYKKQFKTTKKPFQGHMSLYINAYNRNIFIKKGPEVILRNLEDLN